MSMVNNLLAAIKPDSTHFAADRPTDKKLEQAEIRSLANIGSRDKPNRTKNISKTTIQNVDIDAKTQTVIFQKIDENTDSVIYQYPSEARLNLRAYLEATKAEIALPVSLSRGA